MTDLISSGEKENIQDAFEDIHDTFKRPVYVYTNNEGTFVGIGFDDNSAFGDDDGRTTRPNLTKSTIYARIKYLDKPYLATIQDQDIGAQLKVEFPEGTIRLKVARADYETLRKATRLEVDGQAYTLRSEPAKRGPFKNNFFTIYLQRSN